MTCNDKLAVLVVMSYIKKEENTFFFKRILDVSVSVFFTVSRPQVWNDFVNRVNQTQMNTDYLS